MYRHYLILALRHLLKHRLFSGIKILGLTLATASCLLIALYVYNELNYDRMHENGDRIVKANMEYRFGGETVLANVTGSKVSPTFARVFPEIVSGVRMIKSLQVVKIGEQLYEENNLFFADSTFFSIFSFPLLSGNKETILTEPNQVVLTKHVASKYFGSENPVGKFLQIGMQRDYVVAGVMDDPPSNTHIKPDLVVSFTTLSEVRNESWWNANYATYFLLHPNADLTELQNKITAYMKSQSEETGLSGDDHLTFHMEKFNDIHLKSEVPGNFEASGNIRYIYILSLVGFLILLIACTTYINLTIATSTERSREIGVQKVMGVSKTHLIAQNLMESGLIMLITVVLGFLLAKAGLPFFNQLFDRQLMFHELYKADKLWVIILMAVMVSLLSGIYPAMVIARYEPLSALRGFSKSQGRRSHWLKKSLIVFQFGISIVLTISALTLYYQMNYIHNKNLGFEKDLVISLPADGTVIKNYHAIKDQITGLPEVTSMTISYDSPTLILGGYNVGKEASGQSNQPVTALPSGLDFLKTMSIDLLAGQDFSQVDLEVSGRLQEDSTLRRSILINQALAGAWGWSEDEAVGKVVNFNGRRSLIKGVFQNFHFASLHESIEPLVLFPENGGRIILVKLREGHIQKSIDKIRDAWSGIITHRPFNYHFLDEEFAEMYRFETQNARVTYVFTWLAILLACLGLFGVASYGFAQRTREIGIRKVLGSSAGAIFTLLAREYLRLVIFALLVAAPVAWLIMNRWLEQFAYRISMQWWMIVAAGALAFIIAVVTLSYQGIRAALINPVESLKQE